MNTIGERIRYIRKEKLHKSQKDFGQILGLKSNSISCIETGTNTPADQTIKAICREFDINEDWLRNGTEPMRNIRTRNQEIGAFANEIMDLPDDAFKKRFVEALKKLDTKDWETLEKIASTIKEG
ncbi:MAG: helix-turn-helix domain-containing protein [Muribaculum sp.]|nr:helix-turn-helix domain-containing protein [Muribaculum sp.]